FVEHKVLIGQIVLGLASVASLYYGIFHAKKWYTRSFFITLGIAGLIFTGYWSGIIPAWVFETIATKAAELGRRLVEGFVEHKVLIGQIVLGLASVASLYYGIFHAKKWYTRSFFITLGIAGLIITSIWVFTPAYVEAFFKAYDYLAAKALLGIVSALTTYFGFKVFNAKHRIIGGALIIVGITGFVITGAWTGAIPASIFETIRNFILNIPEHLRTFFVNVWPYVKDAAIAVSEYAAAHATGILQILSAIASILTSYIGYRVYRADHKIIGGLLIILGIAGLIATGFWAKILGHHLLARIKEFIITFWFSRTQRFYATQILRLLAGPVFIYKGIQLTRNGNGKRIAGILFVTTGVLLILAGAIFLTNNLLLDGYWYGSKWFMGENSLFADTEAVRYWSTFADAIGAFFLNMAILTTMVNITLLIQATTVKSHRINEVMSFTLGVGSLTTAFMLAMNFLTLGQILPVLGIFTGLAAAIGALGLLVSKNKNANTMISLSSLLPLLLALGVLAWFEVISWQPVLMILTQIVIVVVPASLAYVILKHSRAILTHPLISLERTIVALALVGVLFAITAPVLYYLLPTQQAALIVLNKISIALGFEAFNVFPFAASFAGGFSVAAETIHAPAIAAFMAKYFEIKVSEAIVTELAIIITALMPLVFYVFFKILTKIIYRNAVLMPGNTAVNSGSTPVSNPLATGASSSSASENRVGNLYPDRETLLVPSEIAFAYQGRAPPSQAKSKTSSASVSKISRNAAYLGLTATVAFDIFGVLVKAGLLTAVTAAMQAGILAIVAMLLVWPLLYGAKDSLKSREREDAVALVTIAVISMLITLALWEIIPISVVTAAVALTGISSGTYFLVKGQIGKGLTLLLIGIVALIATGFLTGIIAAAGILTWLTTVAWPFIAAITWAGIKAWIITHDLLLTAIVSVISIGLGIISLIRGHKAAGITFILLGILGLFTAADFYYGWDLIVKAIDLVTTVVAFTRAWLTTVAWPFIAAITWAGIKAWIITHDLLLTAIVSVISIGLG
ncbi:MAG: hypothetical protein WC723_07155, partial [Candidatus Omnitrophota bacterium]